MKKTFVLLLVLLVASCGSSTAPTNEGEGVQSNNSTAANEFNTGAPENNGNGPTGNSDPVDETALPGYTPPVVGPGPVTPPAPTLTEVCGVVYASFYDDVVRLYSNSQTYIVSSGDYSATYYFASNRLTYPSDAMEVCVQTNMDNGMLVSSSVNIIDSSAAHPERTLADDYSYEVCGEFKYITDNGGRTYLEVNDSGVPHIVVDENMPALTLPSFSDENGALVVKGCMYSDEAPYNNFSYTFKKHLKVKAYDFGPLL
jgi:hypothetical protein